MNIGPYDQQMMELQHGQRLADMLRMNAMQPIQSVSNSPLASISPLQVMAQALMGHSANRAYEQNMEGQRQLAQIMEGDTQEGLNKFSEEYGVNPQQAVFNAMASRSPRIIGLGKEAMKGVIQPKQLMDAATNESILASGGNPLGFKPKLELKTVEPGKPLLDQGGNLVNPASVQPGAAPSYQTINGDLYGVTQTGMDQINKAPRTNVSNTVVNGPQNQGLSEVFKKGVQLTSELGEQARGAVETLHSLDNLANLDKQGIFSNLTSKPSAFLVNIAQAVRAPLPQEVIDRLSNTTAYNSEVINVWQKWISQIGTNKGLTKEEAMELKNALPLAAHSPEARAKIIELMRGAATRTIENHRNAVNAYTQSYRSQDPSDILRAMGEMQVPGAATAPTETTGNPIGTQVAPAQVPKFEDLIKQRGIK